MNIVKTVSLSPIRASLPQPVTKPINAAKWQKSTSTILINLKQKIAFKKSVSLRFFYSKVKLSVCCLLVAF